MRPPNHMPCSPDEATVAVLGDATFEKIGGDVYVWVDTLNNLLFSTDQLTRYGATFYKPVPDIPENTRELTEEEMASSGEVFGWYLMDRGWVHHTEVAAPNVGWGKIIDQPWSYRVPIEQKVVAYPDGERSSRPWTGYVAYFATKELRDRAVAEANGRES